MNFYETRAGRTFFEHQLPALTASLQGIARALQKTPTALQLPAEVPSNFLEELYSGNYEPDAEKDKSRMKEYNRIVIEIQKRLKEQVSPQLWNCVDEYRAALDARYCFEAEQAFEAGFRSAVKMIVAGLSAPPCATGGKERT